MGKSTSCKNQLGDFQDAKKIATISKDNNNEKKLHIEYENPPAKKKAAYAEVVTDEYGNKEITNIFESSNFKQNHQRYYESTENVIKKGDKASETNYAKNPLALQDINEGKKVEIYELQGTKKDNLEYYKEKYGCAPRKNFQANGKKIPEEIIQQCKKDKEEYEENKSNNKKGVSSENK